MRISEIFNLDKSQAELDFIDIDPNEDIPLFIDPFYLSIREDQWSYESTLTIRSFFQRLINLIRGGDEVGARGLFSNLHEPNATCLGLSAGSPQGRGVGTGNTDSIFDSIIRSRAIQSGLIQHIEDSHLFVENFGKDKLSDMTTNIIRKHLIEYTVAQCNLHSIPLTASVASGFFWNRATNEWESFHTSMLVIQHKPILLVPKGIASFSKEYTPERYYNHFVLNFLQNENLRINSALVHRRRNGNRFVTKKDIKERNPYSKGFLRSFTEAHPEVLRRFKERTRVATITDSEIRNINIPTIARHLITALNEIPSGNTDASRYHRLIIGILELIFYPHLISPIKEQEIHEGRKRIDIVFDNAAEVGIFRRFSQNMNLPCSYIFVECKNYSSDPENPELDQLSGRFSVNRGRVGFLLCRTIDNPDLFIQRCRDTYTDGRGLIIPLTDADLVSILNSISESNFIETFLSDRVRLIALN